VALRLGLTAVAVVLLAAACGGGNERRDAVESYITQVNAVQAKLRKPLLAVEKAYRDFGSKKGPPIAKLTPRLATSAATMHTLDRRMDALQPPKDAQKLHALIVQLVDSETEIADEVVELARFAPQYAAALQPLATAGQELRDGFGKSKTAKAQADVLDAYAVALAEVLKGLQPLKPPPAYVPSVASQRSAVERVRTTALALADGLRKNKTKALPTLIQSFTNAGIENQSVAAQRARIAAIKSYNRRVVGLVSLARKVDAERLRLEKQFD
jgi:hypothetical protein